MIEPKLEEQTQGEWRNLAPGLVRQRVVIECTTEEPIGSDLMTNYLKELAKIVEMIPLAEPFVYPAHCSVPEASGWGAWQHWATSGVQAYSYTGLTPPLFTVDAYTCKPFSVEKAVEFTQQYLKAKEIVWKEVGWR